MKYPIIFLTLISILQSCDSNSKQQEQQQIKSKKVRGSKTVAHDKSKFSETSTISIEQIPGEIKYEGKIKNVVRWTDKLGDNIVITTETGIYRSDKFQHETEGGDAEIFAYHFLAYNGVFKERWKVYDFISDCPVDIVAKFIDKTFQVTDLDNNGVAEIWLMYKTVCHGDVSPSDMKVIMYEGQQKFAMRGENRVMYGIDDNGHKMYEGGEFKIDNALANGPAVFLEYAKKLWEANLISRPE